jgi:hypothetical protein
VTAPRIHNIAQDGGEWSASIPDSFSPGTQSTGKGIGPRPVWNIYLFVLSLASLLVSQNIKRGMADW